MNCTYCLPPFQQIFGEKSNSECFVFCEQDVFKTMQYTRQMLESKNNVLDKVNRNGSKLLQLSHINEEMRSLTRRFQDCASRSKDWQHKLERGLALWQNLQSQAQPVEEWVAEAEVVISEEGSDTPALIAKHKVLIQTILQRNLNILTTHYN